MSHFRGNFNVAGGRHGLINQNSIWSPDSNCQVCHKLVINKGNLPCGHFLCNVCSEKTSCNICQWACKNSVLRLSENRSVPNLSLTSERNNLYGFDLPYGERPAEFEQLSHTRISPRFSNYVQENREESNQFTLTIPPSISSSSLSSVMSNQSVEYDTSPSPSSYDGFNKNPTSSMTFTPHRELINDCNLDFLQGFCNDTLLTNLPTHSSEFPPRYVSNNHLQGQGIPNSYELNIEELLEDVVFLKCEHPENIKGYFCTDCYQMFCFVCLKQHALHSYKPINDIVNNEDLDMQLISDFNKIGNKINESFQRAKIEENKLIENYKNTLEQIKCNGDILMSELSKRENALKNNVNTIVASKLTGIECQLNQLNVGQENVIPSETSDIYLNSGNLNTCRTMIQNFGNVYGSACNEKTIATGIALSTIIINNPCGFIVQCYDSLGNKCFNDGEDIRATLTCPNEIVRNIEITDLENGYYQGVVSTQVEGHYKLRISLRGYIISEKEYILKSKFYTNLGTIWRCPKQLYRLQQNSYNYFRDMHCDNNGRLVITDTKSNCIHIFDHELKKIKSFGGSGEADGEFRNPHGITVDKEKRIIVVDSGNHRVQVFSYDGEFKFKFGSLGSEKSHFRYPEGVATDSMGNIAVADKRNKRVQMFDKFGNLIGVIKSHSDSISIGWPCGLCFKKDDNLLVSCINENFMEVLEFTIKRTSSQVDFESKGKPIYFSKYQSKDPFGLVTSKEYYILTSLCRREDKNCATSLIIFYNTLTGTIRELSFSQHIPNSVAVSPEGYLYIIVENKIDRKSELHMYG